jgi:hypothetical protein
MGGANASFRVSATTARPKKPGFSSQTGALAQTTQHSPADRSGKRTWTPKELAADLADAFGVPVCERTIVKRCSLPASHPGHIATLAAFPGRHFIPAREVIRLMAAEVSA